MCYIHLGYRSVRDHFSERLQETLRRLRNPKEDSSVITNAS
ncbi:hypothetical protein BTN49_2385 [Candidatus Enterovibrio escicola]|uniref:Uncharacterized protein n=1 Tax=Candidatus Enterovibrio escicola TaxID=1927127 RepID=A0A2A5T1B8_9GAMM|nr:hypothetical protein BTN49_2385 [Candidatus Enterovibrio escacola]